jgi:class 3 adenylate cyclase/tetratricopeptide (TPR) repeat protein
VRVLQTVTVVFTDLVGSTDLRLALGDDRADALTDECARLVTAAVSSAGGEVVKALGDGLMAVFPAAAPAVDGAVAAQLEMARVARRWRDADLAMRVGIATGDADHEGDDWHGIPVVESARLCAAAAGGQILASAMVRTLAGSRSDHQFESVGPVELKGLGEVEAATVLWRREAVRESAELPAPLQRALSPFFVGRPDELTRLVEQLRRAADRDRQTALLCGEPGAGKTRLGAEFASRAADDGWNVLFGRCDDGLGLPYQPFVEALERALPSLDDALLAAHVDRYGGELTRLLPQLARRIDDVPEPLAADAEMARYRLFEATAGLLRDIAAQVPTLLVLDDLHWATEPTVRLLKHMIADPEPARLMVIGTLRETDLAPDDLLAMAIGDFLRLPGVTQLRLDGLAFDDVAVLVGARRRGRVDSTRSLAELVHRQTAGNPLFVEQLLAYLDEQPGGAPPGVTIDLADRPPVPNTVRSVVQQRLHRLEDGTREALRAGAVAGDSFSVALLERVIDHDADALIAELDGGVEAGLLQEIEERPGWYGFKHAIVRTTVNSDVSEARRAQLHHSFTRAFESADIWSIEPSVLALHARGAIPAGGDVDFAVDVSLNAARAALASLGAEQALTQLDAAAAVLADAPRPDAARRFEIEALRVDATAQLLDVRRSNEHLRHAFRIALEAGEPEWTSRLDVHYSRAGVLDADPELIANVQAVVDTIGDRDSRARAQAMGMLAYQRLFRDTDPEIERLASDARVMAERLGEPDTIAGTAMVHALAIRDPARQHDRRDMLRRALHAAEDAAPRPRAMHYYLAASRWLGLALLEIGDRTWLDEHIDDLERLPVELGSPMNAAHARQIRAMLAMLDGRFDEAEELAARVLELGADDADYAIGYAGQIQALRRDQGRSEEMLPLLQAFAASNPDLSLAPAAVALTMTECDQPDEAAAILDRYASAGFESLPRDFSWPIVPVFLAEVAAAVGNADAARQLEGLVTPYRGRLQFVAESGVYVFGAVDRALGQFALAQGRLDDAVSAFESAIELERSIGASPLVARSQRWLVSALHARASGDDMARATTIASEAHATAQSLGMARIAAETLADG